MWMYIWATPPWNSLLWSCLAILQIHSDTFVARPGQGIVGCCAQFCPHKLELETILYWVSALLDEVHVVYAVDYKSALKSPAPLWSIYWEPPPPDSNISIRACLWLSFTRGSESYAHSEIPYIRSMRLRKACPRCNTEVHVKRSVCDCSHAFTSTWRKGKHGVLLLGSLRMQCNIEKPYCLRKSY